MQDIVQTYQEAEDYLLSVPKFTKKNSHQATREFYEFLGKPGSGARIVHVAGTNGKGSVCAYMDSVLREGGYTVGMFTSPHLVTMRERFRFQGEWMGEEDFLSCFGELRQRLEKYREQEGLEAYHPTFFEFLFFMAMLWFEKKQPEVLILETGLGGRLDATNVIDCPKVCVITEIGMDHMEYLGDTPKKIAGEKAGIIKSGCRVVYSKNRRESSAVIEKKAEEKGCFCRGLSKVPVEQMEFQNKHIAFSFPTRYYDNVRFCVSTTALYQVENASLALAALEELKLPLTKHQLQEGIVKCRWEGRMEEVLPGVFLDGAHNEDGIAAFLEAVSREACEGERWILFSMVADKEYRSMEAMIVQSGLFAKSFAAPLRNARGLTLEALQELLAGTETELCDSPEEGLARMLSERKPEDKIYVAGSLYLVGQMKECLRN